VILIAFDGSDDARTAIEAAAKLFPGQPAMVLTVWERFIDVFSRAGSPAGAVIDYETIDKAAQEGAEKRAAEGAALAKQAGLDATGETVDLRTNVADAIKAQADELDADAIVVGSRGLTGIKSALLGSVSHGVVHHAGRPVVVVPPHE
jgi:nucleotide-binding universal stress UspA family protein